jgi:hypothetical protein
MAEVVLFHHAHGLTSGCLALADELGAAGHAVHASDLYDGQTFAELADGIGYTRQVGFRFSSGAGLTLRVCRPSSSTPGCLSAVPAQQRALYVDR